MAETEDKGYTVKDRRYLHMSEEEKAKVREETAAQEAAQETAAPEGESPEEVSQEAAEAAKTAREIPLPEITFASFLFSLSSSAFVHLGAMPDPHTGKNEKNLLLAKQTIDLLGLLREKTRNNLTSEEENLFDHLLYDLRMQYIKEVG